VNCWHCGEEIKLLAAEKVQARDVCPKCDADLHVCRNCRHFDPSVHNECRETQAEWVRTKDRANYCDWFSPLSVVPMGSRPRAAGTDSVRKKFDDLFKNL
jgi:hypothetical protein